MVLRLWKYRKMPLARKIGMFYLGRKLKRAACNRKLALPILAGAVAGVGLTMWRSR